MLCINYTIMDGLGDLLGRLGPWAGLALVALIAFIAWLRIRRPNPLKVELDVTVHFQENDHGPDEGPRGPDPL